MPSQQKSISALITLNLIAQVIIILTGGLVRLTGSGLGCSTWPQCEPGHFTPITYEATSYHPYVEWGNRLFTFVLAATAGLLALAVWRAMRQGSLNRSPQFFLLSFAPLIGVIIQALIGGLTVIMELHPAVVGFHFLISAGLVWVSAWLWWRWREGDGPTEPIAGPVSQWLVRVLLLAASALIVLGIIVTGSGPHSGDEEVGYRFAVDPLSITRAHSVSAWVFTAVLLALTFHLYQLSKAQRRREITHALKQCYIAIGVTALQGAIGYYQYFNGLPIIAVSLHLLGSALLVIAVAGVAAGTRTRGQLPHGQSGFIPAPMAQPDPAA